MIYLNLIRSLVLLALLGITINNGFLVSSQHIGHRDRIRNGTRGSYLQNKPHPCEKSSCYPQTGNLLIGREHQLYASSTCGLEQPQRYCIVSHLEERKKCFWCDSSPGVKPDLNHNISNIVYRVLPGSLQKTWWQSENGKENVYIQLDLEAEFHFTHIIIRFKTFRPAAMLIERSFDFKKTWHVYRYFAYNCEESFPGISTEQAHNLTDVICESKYSNVAPSTDGEIIYRVLLPHVRIDNPYSNEVQNLMKVTNLRINFTKLHTLGDDLLDRRVEIQEKYYYAISDMIVRGSCSCYGHANRCLPLKGYATKGEMVHGRCECTHNTKGRNCEKCEDFFNDLPWSPAVGKQTNACKPCNCNNHATSCHFDAAVYEASGRVSGGVCDGCKHNTMGTNCEQCKSFYYRDPDRDIQDPEVCRPCDCDSYGSLDGGICDSTTDPNNNLIAGACHCKTNVEGRRCDRCKNGYWNFTQENPDGCESCTCNTLGTIDNQGCNVYTGECICKRYVTGRDCNQCLPEFWGLSEKRDGCEPCDCDLGGSYDNFCDVITGQCKCLDHMTGRTCSTPKQQYFTASLDFLLYEAELAKSSANCQVVIREPYRDGRENTWTGTGFMKAPEGSTVEFVLDNIRRSMLYDIGLRFDPMRENYDEVIIKIVGPEDVDPNGYCINQPLDSNIRQFDLPANSRGKTIQPPVCLEEGKQYKVIVEFVRAKHGRDTPSASVLVDSIVLRPHIESIPWFHGSAPAETRRREFELHRCALPDEIYKGPVSEVCKEMYNSIGAYVIKGGIACQCDRTGSVSRLCAQYGGECTCKQNVVGRRCDRCAPGTFGFGPEGCIACDCNSIGSLDNFCNATTGQCNCRANTYGRQCDQCQTGFWNFPNCQRCDCNGHADTCDSHTGACISCRDNTEGHTCDHCIEGFYGDPRLSVDIACRPCPCPGIPGSGHSYAERCSLDDYTKDVVCECQEGYSGPRCDVCADNYFGYPEEPGGTCQPCDCNNKIDILKPGNCDPKTGKCKQCLYDTTGDHCEKCSPGFYRSFDSDTCLECVCHILGTNSSAGYCDHNTGQCPCYPNVTGIGCDQCEENHWKIASGSGCDACDCDPVGSLSPQCNPFDGQCECKPNYGGRQCNECKQNYWGNPKKNECYECTCNIYGSATMQCDRKTGACVCNPGIGEYNCDKCARGYIGEAPNCSPCGECFNNWDRILNEYKNSTLIEIERAKNIKKVGATGAYTKEFDEMQQKLDEIEKLLNSTETIDLNKIDKKSVELRNRIKELNEGKLKELSESLGSASQGNQLDEINLKDLETKLNLLKNKTKELEHNGTLLQEANVQGALNLIEQAKSNADRAAENTRLADKEIDYAERQCKATQNLIQVTKKEFDDKHAIDEKALQDITNSVNNLTRSLPELNNLVCDRWGDPCDSICGGAGCGVCGNTVSCENGAKQQAEMALILANETEDTLKETEKKAFDFIRNISTVNATLAKQMAQQAYNIANNAYKQSNDTFFNISNVRERIEEFLNQNTTNPDDIEKLAKEVKAQNIQLDPDEIKILAKKIKEAVQSLTDIDPIIEETKDDLERVQRLKENADNAKLKVQEIKNTTVNVKHALGNSTLKQQQAEKAINSIGSNVDGVKSLINAFEEKVADTKSQIDDTSKQITNLSEKLESLSINITKNSRDAATFENRSKIIKDEAQATHQTLQNLRSKYDDTKKTLDATLENVESSKTKADNLVSRAVKLTAKITKIEDDIAKLTQMPEYDLTQLQNSIDYLIGKMKEYNKEIQRKSDYYKTCT